MTEFSEGDLVEAVKGERRVIDRVRKAHNGDLFIPGVGFFPRDDYTTIVIERAAPALPTEPGFYSDRKGDAWKLADNGFWYDSGYVNGASMRNRKYIATLAPFTRLEPVADTAKKVLDFVLEQNRYADDFWERIQEFGNQLGVSND